MPGFNQKGPEGAGAMTGRQRGMCRRTENQSFAGDGSGRGRGLGMRRGLGQGQGQSFGLGRRFDSGVEPLQSSGIDVSEELRNLKEQYLTAQKMLITLEQKIAALETGK
jgi:hypothetical protein